MALTQPSDHQTVPFGAIVIRCGVRPVPPVCVFRILYSFRVPLAVYSPISATASVFSVNQTSLEASTVMPYGLLFVAGVATSWKLWATGSTHPSATPSLRRPAGQRIIRQFQ